MFEPGTTFGGYRIDGAIGRGGMGVVLEATQLSLDRTVALKILAPGLSADSSFRERFRREGPIQARLDHPHIVSVFEAGELEGHLFLAMRLVRGSTLKELVATPGLDPHRAVSLLVDIADALDSAHEQGLIHRDVKPQNILVGRRDHAYLADFGLTKVAGERSLTKSGHFVGTLDYISPEQIQGRPASHSSDVYALAAVLFEALAGHVPFPKQTDAALLYAHVAEDVPRLSALRPDLPTALDEVVAAGMAKSPADRPGSAVELLAAAAGALEAPSVRRTPPAPPFSPTPEPVTPVHAGASTVTAGAITAPAADTLSAQHRVAPAATLTAEAVRADAPAPVATVPDVTGADSVAVAVPGSGERAQREVATVSATAQAPAPSRAGAPIAAGAVHTAARSAPRARATRRLAGAAASVALVVAAVLAGLVVGQPDPRRLPPVARARAAAGIVSVAAPRSWRAQRDEPEIPGLTLADPVVRTDASGNGATMVAGRVRGGAGATLLPAAFLERLPEQPTLDDTVRLGTLEARRYVGLRPHGFDRRLTLYVVSTSKGVAAVACFAPDIVARGFLARCEEAATTLRLAGGVRAFPLGPRRAYARVLNGALRAVGPGADSVRADLRRAKTFRGQAHAAADLGSAYRHAAAELAGARTDPAVGPAHRRLVAALRRVARTYGAASRAAHDLSTARYLAAGRRLDRDLAAVRHAVAALKPLGYR
jgi:hypothetical protein